MARHKLKKRDIHGPRTFYDVRLDLHGMFSEEAMRKVEKTIAANPGRSILVIHGHGTGVPAICAAADSGGADPGVYRRPAETYFYEVNRRTNSFSQLR